MTESEQILGSQILQIAEDRTYRDFTPFVVSHEFPSSLVSGLRGGIFDLDPSVSAYGLMADALAQSAINITRREVIRDDTDSLYELVRILKLSQEQILDDLVSSRTKDLVTQGLVEGSKKWMVRGDRYWLEGIASTGISRVEQFAYVIEEVNKPF